MFDIKSNIVLANARTSNSITEQALHSHQICQTLSFESLSSLSSLGINIVVPSAEMGVDVVKSCELSIDLPTIFNSLDGKLVVSPEAFPTKDQISAAQLNFSCITKDNQFKHSDVHEFVPTWMSIDKVIKSVTINDLIIRNTNLRLFFKRNLICLHVSPGDRIGMQLEKPSLCIRNSSNIGSDKITNGSKIVTTMSSSKTISVVATVLYRTAKSLPELKTLKQDKIIKLKKENNIYRLQHTEGILKKLILQSRYADIVVNNKPSQIVAGEEININLTKIHTFTVLSDTDVFAVIKN